VLATQWARGGADGGRADGGRADGGQICFDFSMVNLFTIQQLMKNLGLPN